MMSVGAAVLVASWSITLAMRLTDECLEIPLPEIPPPLPPLNPIETGDVTLAEYNHHLLHPSPAVPPPTGDDAESSDDKVQYYVDTLDEHHPFRQQVVYLLGDHVDDVAVLCQIIMEFANPWSDERVQSAPNETTNVTMYRTFLQLKADGWTEEFLQTALRWRRKKLSTALEPRSTFNPIYEAVDENDETAAMVFLNAGVRWALSHKPALTSVLLIAPKKGMSNVVEALLVAKADVDASNDHAETALHLAA